METRAIEGLAASRREPLDALPYIDTLTPVESRETERLIAEETEKSDKKPRDYLKEMPPVAQPTFKGSHALMDEYERVRDGQPKHSPDVHRYTLPAPEIELQNDPAAWEEALENAQAQLEHQHLRALNLELAMSYAPESWKQGNEQANRLNIDFKEDLSGVKDQIVEINKKRKLSQVEVGVRLSKLEREWHQLVLKNYEILQACDSKRANIQQKCSQLKQVSGEEH